MALGVRNKRFRRRPTTSTEEVDLRDYLIDSYVTPNCIEWAVNSSFTLEDEIVRRAADQWKSDVIQYITTWPRVFEPSKALLERETLKSLEDKVLPKDRVARKALADETREIVRTALMCLKAAQKVEKDTIEKNKRAHAAEEDLYNFLRVISP